MRKLEKSSPNLPTPLPISNQKTQRLSLCPLIAAYPSWRGIGLASLYKRLFAFVYIQLLADLLTNSFGLGTGYGVAGNGVADNCSN